MTRWLPNTPDETLAENSDNSSDFFSSWGERGRKSRSNWRVLVIVFTAILVMCVLFASHVLAAPPQAGSVNYTFEDPYFGSNVLCDSADEIRAIASSEKPNQTFGQFYATPNVRNQPTCAAGNIMAIAVVNVEALGVMTFDSGDTFNAWVIEVDLGPMHGFVLYLEHFEEVHA